MVPTSIEYSTVEDASWDAFISYRRSDGKSAARWLRWKLQTYRFPATLGRYSAKRCRVYLDTAYGRTTDDFYTKNIQPALLRARFLIVILTPDLMRPNADGSANWVIREITDFLECRSAEHVLLVRARGAELQDPLPDILLQRLPNPHIADLRSLTWFLPVRWWRHWRLHDALVDLIPTIFKVDGQDVPILRREEQRRKAVKTTTFATVSTLVAILLVFLTVFAFFQKSAAENQARISTALRLAAESDRLRSNHPSRLQLTTLLAAEASKRFPSVETGQALQSAVAFLAQRKHKLEHGGSLKAVVFSTDAELSATVGKDRQAKVWKTFSGTPLKLDIPATGQTGAIALSPDGHVAVANGQDIFVQHLKDRRRWTLKHPGSGEIFALKLSNSGRYLYALSHVKQGHPSDLSVWELKTSDAVLKIRRTGSGANYADDAVFSPVESHIVIDMSNSAPEVWDLGTGLQGPALARRIFGVQSLAFTSDGRHLATGESNGAVRVWDLEDGHEVVSFKCGEAASALAFDHDGRRLAAGSFREVRVWEVDSGYETLHLPHGTGVNHVEFSSNSSNNDILLTNSQDGTIRLWDANNRLEFNRIARHGGGGIPHLSLDGRFVAAQDSSTIVWIWALGRGDIVCRVHEGTGAHAAVLSSANHYLATASPGDETMRVWTLNGDRAENIFEARGGGKLAFSPDEKYLAASLNGSTSQGAVGTSHVWIYDVAERQEVAKITHEFTMENWSPPEPREQPKFPCIRVTAITFSNSGTHLATASSVGMVRVTRVVDGEKETEKKLISSPMLLAFTTDDRQLVAVCSDGKVRSLDVLSGAVTPGFAYGTGATPLALSRDGLLLATQSELQLSVWNLRTHQAVLQTQSRTEEERGRFDPVAIQAAAFSQEASYLATAQYHKDSRIATVRVWNLDRNQEVTRLISNYPAAGISFSSDGAYIVTSGSDTIVRFWKHEDLLKLAGQRLSRNLTRNEFRLYLGEEPYEKTYRFLP